AFEERLDTIERKLLEGGDREVQSSVIGEEVCRALHELDEVAYVRFASVYRSFQDIGEFMSELQDLIAERKGKVGAKPARGPRSGGPGRAQRGPA
ncbi:MAG: ATP cone domain-containing protein, partial [Alphaproteobacteria bacterium]